MEVGSDASVVGHGCNCSRQQSRKSRELKLSGKTSILSNLGRNEQRELFPSCLTGLVNISMTLQHISTSINTLSSVKRILISPGNSNLHSETSQ
jgi:hypothetical protein